VSDSEDSLEPSPQPGKATAEQGAVLLDGPRGAAVTLTPEAAEATGESLRRAAAVAEDQRRAARLKSAEAPRPLHPDKRSPGGSED
jgi:hypothetical protein